MFLFDIIFVQCKFSFIMYFEISFSLQQSVVFHFIPYRSAEFLYVAFQSRNEKGWEPLVQSICQRCTHIQIRRVLHQKKNVMCSTASPICKVASRHCRKCPQKARRTLTISMPDLVPRKGFIPIDTYTIQARTDLLKFSIYIQLLC